ncbi:flagellar assembly protein FliH [Sulfurimonas sp.]
MATHIRNEKLSKHDIDKYNFKVLAIGSSDSEKEQKASSNLVQSTEKEEQPSRRESDIDSSAMSQSSKDSLIESLMKKTDEMSSNFIKLQMKLEDKEEEYKKELENVKELSFNEGIEVGKQQAVESGEADLTNGMAQFSSSVARLEESAKEFESALEGIKNDLITAALDIAKEVVGVELKENSVEVAKTLGDELIKELQSASNITLKVNPNDHGVISEHVGSLAHVQVISDSAVSEGGVIAISDAGNIDSQISKRFERVKRAALSE